MKYIGLWHGGHSYSQGEWATDAETFTNLEHAKGVFTARFNNYAYPPVTYAVEWNDDGTPCKGHRLDRNATPCVDDDATLVLVKAEHANLEVLTREHWQAITHIISMGTRGGVKVERV